MSYWQKINFFKNSRQKFSIKFKPKITVETSRVLKDPEEQNANIKHNFSLYLSQKFDTIRISIPFLHTVMPNIARIMSKKRFLCRIQGNVLIYSIPFNSGETNVHVCIARILLVHLSIFNWASAAQKPNWMKNVLETSFDCVYLGCLFSLLSESLIAHIAE